MDVRFDLNAANYLIAQMNSYCMDMQREATDILDILEFSGKWDDSQMRQFHGNILDISKELIQAMQLENEYMNVFRERVEELKD